MDCHLINHNEFCEKYLLDRLGESEKREFERHLESCERCQNELAEQRTFIQGLRAAGRAAMKQEIRHQTSAFGSESKITWAPWMKAAAVLFVVVGTSSIYLVFRDQEAQRAPFVAREVSGPAEKVAGDEALENQKRTADLERSEVLPESRPTQKTTTGTGDIRPLSISRSGVKVENEARQPAEQEDRLFSETTAIKVKSGAVPSVEAKTTLSGRVTDQAGNPLPGANILIAGTNIGAATDPAGRYTLVVPTEALTDQLVTLECRFIGYETTIESVALQGSELARDFRLEESALAMDAVVVTKAVDEAPKRPTSLSRAKALTRTASVGDTSDAPTGVALLSTSHSGQPKKPPAQISFQSGDRTFRVRLVPSEARPATNQKTGLPASFLVTISRKDSLAVEMDWHVPPGFSESRLESALFQTSQQQLLVVTLKQGTVYRIPLTSDSTEAKLEK